MSRALLLAVVASVLLAMCVSAASVQPLHESEYQSHFTGFVKKFTKKYAHDEFFPRYAIFKANLNKIREHNQSGASFSMAVNEFADMSWEEFHAKMTGLRAVDNSFLRSKNGPHQEVQANADALDWRAKGAVTPVKNQQSCGSCWAFSATGSMEGAIAVKTGQLLNLSEQQLVDCSRSQGNHGCNGGLMDYAFQYVMTNGGITSQDQYPYTARDETCKRNVTSVATISSFVDVAAGSETALMNAINLHPVSVAIAASPSAFQFYSGGVLDDASCGSRLDHGVTLVGYGTDSALNKDFWILKNSWGTGWGESGYVRFVRGKNQCGVANMASYPIA